MIESYEVIHDEFKMNVVIYDYSYAPKYQSAAHSDSVAEFQNYYGKFETSLQIAKFQEKITVETTNIRNSRSGDSW